MNRLLLDALCTCPPRLSILCAGSPNRCAFASHRVLRRQLSAATAAAAFAYRDTLRQRRHNAPNTAVSNVDRSISRPLTDFRQSISTLLTSERAGSGHDVIVLALDGIPLTLARAHWPRARIEGMDSVFPSTSATAWLSSLSGMTVEEHGIPGVVFRTRETGLINIYRHHNALDVPDRGNIFADAVAAGYRAIAISADLEAAPCAWLDVLLRGAERIGRDRFYAGDTAQRPEHIVESIRAAVRRERDKSQQPNLIWCFVEVDRHIHRHGYDADVLRLLDLVDALAVEWARTGAMVIAHSDHGLVPTQHDPEIAAAIEASAHEFGCHLGGAGRTRWFYPEPGDRERMLARLQQRFAGIARVCASEEMFLAGSEILYRVGSVLLIAETGQFATFDGHRFDHGSCLSDEIEVPFAHWNGD
ncbi:MAG: hypothetical protein E6Q88_02920 [Lysobacteraceae bacterium]|nr:MAG: hypothetical protein E6Q88_02920 [Xanthomonadaceae bacterium]